MKTKTGHEIVTRRQINMLENLGLSKNPNQTIRYTQDEAKTAKILVGRNMIHQAGQNSFRISAYGRKIVKSKNYHVVR